jgi:parallel beta-helix repeat protein
MKLSLSIALLIGILVGRSSFAATFYVATTGNDSNSCIQAQNPSIPKRNIMGASGGISCLVAGDTLDIRSGTYDEQIVSHVGTTFPSGTASQPITIQGHAGETIITRRFGFHTGANIQYWIIDNLIIDDQNDSGNNGIFFGASNNHMTLKNTEIKNASCMGIQGGASFLRVINVNVHDNGSNCPASGGHAFGVGYGIYWWGADTLFERMKVHSNHGYGFHIFDSGSTIVSRNVVRYSRIHSNAGPERGIGLLLSCGSNNEAYGNLIYDNEGGIQIDYRCTDCLVYNNTVFNNTPLGQGIGIARNVLRAVVKNNIVYGNAVNGIANNGASSVISNNLCDSAAAGCSVTGNPLFADLMNRDLVPLVGSPVIGAGTRDIDANISLPFVPDIGAMLDLVPLR